MIIYRGKIICKSDGFCVEEIFSTDKSKLKREVASRLKGRNQLTYTIGQITTL